MCMRIQNNQRTLHSLQLYQVSHCNTLNIRNVIFIVGPHTATTVSSVSTTTTAKGTPTNKPSSTLSITIII